MEDFFDKVRCTMITSADSDGGFSWGFKADLSALTPIQKAQWLAANGFHSAAHDELQSMHLLPKTDALIRSADFFEQVAKLLKQRKIARKLKEKYRQKAIRWCQEMAIVYRNEASRWSVRALSWLQRKGLVALAQT